MLTIQNPANRVFPNYLNLTDRVWIESLIDCYMQHVGRSQRKVEYARMEFRNLYNISTRNFNVVSRILDSIFSTEIQIKNNLPKAIRHEVFKLAASKGANFQNSADANRIFALVGKRLSLNVKEIQNNLFSDLPKERLLVAPSVPIDPELVRLKANLAILQSLLAKSDLVRIKISGQSRPIVRHAKLKGLICTVCHNPGGKWLEFSLSGPLSILRKTSIYGKALGELVPYLGLCNDFEMRISIPGDLGKRFLLVKSGDPVFPKDSVKKFDSKIEEKFYAQFSRLTDDWVLVREPKALRSGNKLIFPDFSIRHKSDDSLFWLIEIIGFWTRDYVESKLRDYANLNNRNVILCAERYLRLQKLLFQAIPS